jgi:hypothetical protein
MSLALAYDSSFEFLFVGLSWSSWKVENVSGACSSVGKMLADWCISSDVVAMGV